MARTLGWITVLLVIGTSLLCAAVPREELSVTFDPEERSLEGTLDIQVTSSRGTLYFMLPANLGRLANPFLSPRELDAMYPYGFEASSTSILTVDTVRSDSIAPQPFRLLRLPPLIQTYALEKTVLAVDDLPQGEPVTLRIDFVTLIPRTKTGDEGVTEGILTWRTGWAPTLVPLELELGETDGMLEFTGTEWMPYLLARVDRRVTLTIPETMQFVSGADSVERLDDEDPEHETVVLQYDRPTRTAPICVGADYAFYRLDGATPIEVAYLPGHEDTARLFATYARDIVAWFSERFTNYPHRRLTIVENPNTNGVSFAADGIVWLASTHFTHRHVGLPGILDRLTEYVLAHEIAHQWLNLAVDFNADNWISEGLAQVLAVRWFEDRHGAFEPNVFVPSGTGLLEDLVASQFGYYNLREHNIELPYVLNLYNEFDEPLFRPIDRVRYDNATTVRLYDKAYLVARGLSWLVGEETFDAVLRRMFVRSLDEPVTTAGFRTLLLESTDRPMADAFDAWVSGEDAPDLSIRIVSRARTPGGYRTEILVGRTGSPRVPVEIELELTSGAVLRRTWDGIAEDETLSFETPSAVVRATLDPDHRIPDGDRRNNHSPVRFVGALTESALPLDAYVLSASAEGTTIGISFLDRFRFALSRDGLVAEVRDGRSDAYALSVSSSNAGWVGGIGFSRTLFAVRETGSAAAYVEEDVQWTVSGLRLAAGTEPVYVLRFTIANLPSIASTATQRIAIDFSEGTGRFLVRSFAEARLAPSLYLQADVRIGLGSPALPSVLAFSFDELYCDPPDAAPSKASATIGLEIPVSSETPYNLLNLAAIDRVRARVYVSAALGWTSLGDFGTTSIAGGTSGVEPAQDSGIPTLEGGMEQIIDLSTLGGLLPIRVVVGMAIPIGEPGNPMVYVQVSL